MIRATNDFVFILRDETKKEQSGLLLPESSRKKPHKGVIFSVGDLVRDRNIKSGKGKPCLFHQGVGFTVEHEGQEYLVLSGNEIIAVL